MLKKIVVGMATSSILLIGGPLFKVFSSDLKINTKMIGYMKMEKTALINHAKLSKEYYFKAKHLVKESRSNAQIINSTP